MPDNLTETIVATASRPVPTDRWHAVIVRLMRSDTARIDGKAVWELAPGADLALVNAGENASLELGAKGMALLCRIDVRQLRGLLNDRPVAFACSPSLRHHEGYAELRSCIDALLRTLSEGGDFAQLHRQAAELALIQCLLDRFGALPSSDGHSIGQRACAYLDTHYAESVGLAEVAHHLGVSPEHLARTFKRETGKTLLAYLAQVRLEAAQELLRDSDMTVTRAALDAGFPNVGSLNQAFRRAEGTTPSAWRRTQQLREQDSSVSSVSDLQDLLAPPQTMQRDSYVVRFSPRDSLASGRPWREAMGIGTVESLRSARIREQVLWLSARVPFSHWRVICELDSLATEEGRRHAEGCLDFLLDNGLCPRLALEAISLEQPAALEAGFSALLKRCVNRYSVQNVRTWEFELRCKRNQRPDSPGFIDLFARVSSVLARYGTASLMGPGIAVGSDGTDLRLFLSKARSRGIALGGITIACRPEVRSEGQTSVVRTADSRYLRNQIMIAREALAQEGLDPHKVIVGGWSNTLGHSNVMSDSCFAGAAMVQAYFSCRELTTSICYDWALDRLCYQDADEARPALSGLPGLVTRDGIPKPTLYAFDFLNHVGEHVVYADEHCVASTNDMGNYQIVCHNCERLGARYLATPEDQLAIEELGSYFDDPAPRTVRLQIEGIRRGSYLVKKRIVNADAGSVSDVAQRMNLLCLDEPGRGEVAYLGACAQPRLQLERTRVDNGTLQLSHELASNEIAYLHLIYLY